MDLPHAWKLELRRRLPSSVMNALLIRLPWLYRTQLVGYESHISREGLRELITHFDLASSVDGDIVECGSAHCGTSIVLAQHAISRGVRKVVFACDSYQGFDEAELAREHALGLSDVPSSAFKSASYDYVVRKIAALGMDQWVIPVRGYFQETLPRLSGPFCMALIDCDLRESLLFAARAVWPRLSGGGRILFHDYLNPGFKGAREGTDQFIQAKRSEISNSEHVGDFYVVVKVR